MGFFNKNPILFNVATSQSGPIAEQSLKCTHLVFVTKLVCL
ncbi:hypothetical protein bmyco0003_48450 [Bacillus pseudomycoides]|nr:hypothetical protein bmyco0003_48450 [Bacillus pseudomycoides]